MAFCLYFMKNGVNGLLGIPVMSDVELDSRPVHVPAVMGSVRENHHNHGIVIVVHVTGPAGEHGVSVQQPVMKGQELELDSVMELVVRALLLTEKPVTWGPAGNDGVNGKLVL